MTQREIFLRHLAQTSSAPLALEITKAEGCRLTDSAGKNYIDLIGGISVANTGHRHPDVLKAIKEQLDDFLHIMVYGEFISSPQVKYAKALTDNLPATLNTVYFTNSGAEAVEGAMKLAKRISNRTQMVAFNNSYHGSTQGALSLIGDEYWRNAFRPLLPGITHLPFNDISSLDMITNEMACVIVEPVQAEAGVRSPDLSWIAALKKKCDETGALLVFDEIQTGFGRTGSLWAFEQLQVIPDILILGKALGGGMPMGAFIADKKKMDAFTDNPVLGHITTFGGHPVCCAAGLAAFQVLFREQLIENVKEKEQLFRSKLSHRDIKSLHSAGLWLAIEFDGFAKNKSVIDACIADGLLTDWFLFAPACLRISPPLTISEEEIETACKIILKALG